MDEFECVSTQEPIKVQLARVPPAGMQALGGTARGGHPNVYVGLAGLLVLDMEMASHSWSTAGKGIIYVCVAQERLFAAANSYAPETAWAGTCTLHPHPCNEAPVFPGVNTLHFSPLAYGTSRGAEQRYLISRRRTVEKDSHCALSNLHQWEAKGGKTQRNRYKLNQKVSRQCFQAEVVTGVLFL